MAVLRHLTGRPPVEPRPPVTDEVTKERIRKRLALQRARLERLDVQAGLHREGN